MCCDVVVVRGPGRRKYTAVLAVDIRSVLDRQRALYRIAEAGQERGLYETRTNTPFGAEWFETSPVRC
jgi:hypothetical protein